MCAYLPSGVGGKRNPNNEALLISTKTANPTSWGLAYFYELRDVFLRNTSIANL